MSDGLTTGQVPEVELIDDLLGNRDGSAARITAEKLAALLAETGAIASKFEEHEEGVEQVLSDAEEVLAQVDLVKQYVGSAVVPIGSMMPFYFSTVPTGWLRIRGQPITSDMPDFRQYLLDDGAPVDENGDPLLVNPSGYFLRIWDEDGGVDPEVDRAIRSFQSDEFRQHTHDVKDGSGGSQTGSITAGGGNFSGQNDTGVWRSSDEYTLIAEAGGEETRPPNVAFPLIIKAFHAYADLSGKLIDPATVAETTQLKLEAQTAVAEAQNAQAASAESAEAAADAQEAAELAAGTVSRATSIADLTDPTTLSEGDGGLVSGSGSSSIDGVYEVQSSAWVKIGELSNASKASRQAVDFDDAAATSDILIADLLGFIMARLGAARFRTSQFEVGKDGFTTAEGDVGITPDLITGGGLKLLTGETFDGLALVDAAGFISRVLTHRQLIEPTDREGIFARDGFGFLVKLSGGGSAAPVDEDPLPVPVASDGRGLFTLRAKLAALRSAYTSEAVTAKLAYIADSWGERATTILEMADILYNLYGQGSQGWLAAAQTSAEVGGADVQHSGTVTKHDITSERGAPSGPYGVSGDWVEISDAVSSVSFLNLRASTVYLYAEDRDGTFRYQVDGGAWTAVVGTDTGAPVEIEISGLDPETTHGLVIDTTGNTGTVALVGIYATGLPGAELSKVANAGAFADDLNHYFSGALCTSILARMRPDSAFISFGTNDVSSNKSLSGFKAAHSAAISALKAAAPHCGVVLGSAPESSRSGAYEMSDYRDVTVELAGQLENVEFLNLLDLFGANAATGSAGEDLIWNDSAHLNYIGGRMLSGLLIEKFWHML